MLARFAWSTHRWADIALALNRQDAALAMQLGNYYFNGGAYDLEKAEQAFRRALEIEPAVLGGHYQLGRISFIKGDLFAAMRKIDEELALHPDFPNSYYMRGLIEGYRGNYRAAEENFQAFVERMPLRWAGYNDLAWVLVKQRKFREAAAAVTLAFDRMPIERSRNAWLWISLGVARLNLGEYDGAKEALATALSLAERMTPEYFWGAYPGNNPEEAPQAFSDFLATIHFNLGLVSERQGLIGEARKEYQAYLALLPARTTLERSAVEEKIKTLGNERQQ